jgi:serpin B
MGARSGAGDSSHSTGGRALVAGICILFLLGCAAFCSSQLASAGKSQGSKPGADSPSVAPTPGAATEAFGLDLLAAQRPGNVVLSPDSVATALAMTGTGASGRTAAQIAETLHLRGPAAFKAIGNLQRTIAAEQAAAAEGDPKAPTLEMANGLFLQQGFPLGPAFLSGLQRHFGAAPETVDFAGNLSGSREAINSWVSDRTKGIIPELFGSLPAETRLVLANAIYLKAAWRYPFERRDTRPAPFYSPAGSTQAEFMHQLERLRYGSGRGYKAVELPYRASTLSLLVVLPRKGSLVALQRRLGGGGLARVARNLSPEMVDLSLPRFHLTTKVSLGATLKSLGMPLAFSDDADFSRMTTAERLKIGLVEHAADLAIDEEGTVAAAATGVGVVAVSGPPPATATFNANRPFLFFVRDSSTGAVLFAGRLTSPAPADAG